MTSRNSRTVVVEPETPSVETGTPATVAELIAIDAEIAEAKAKADALARAEEIATSEETVQIEDKVLRMIRKTLDAIKTNVKIPDVLKVATIANVLEVQAITLGVEKVELERLLEDTKPVPGLVKVLKEHAFAQVDSAAGLFSDFLNFAMESEGESRAFYALCAVDAIEKVRHLQPPEGGSAGYILMLATATPRENIDSREPFWIGGDFAPLNYGWNDGDENRRQYTHRRIPKTRSEGTFLPFLTGIFHRNDDGKVIEPSEFFALLTKVSETDSEVSETVEEVSEIDEAIN